MFLGPEERVEVTWADQCQAGGQRDGKQRDDVPAYALLSSQRLDLTLDARTILLEER